MGRKSAKVRGHTYINIHFLFLGSSDLLLVKPQYRVCYGPVVLASCLSTILVAVMVFCGKSQHHISLFSMYVTFIWFLS